MKRTNNDTRAQETVAPAAREIIKLVLQARDLLEAAQARAYLRGDNSVGDTLCDVIIDAEDVARSYLPPALPRPDSWNSTAGMMSRCVPPDDVWSP